MQGLCRRQVVLLVPLLPPTHVEGMAEAPPAAGVPSLTPNEVHTASSPSQSSLRRAHLEMALILDFINNFARKCSNQSCATDGETEAPV